MVNINLLPDLKSEDKKKSESAKKVNLAFVIVAVILLSGAIGVFVFQQLLASNLAKVNTDINILESAIDADLETETLLVGVKSRVDSIESILNNRKKYSIFLNQFSNYVPQSIRISDLTVGADSKAVINGEAPSYEKLAGFVIILSGEDKKENTASEATQKIFSNVSLNSVSRSESGGNVRFSISFTIQQGAFNEK